MLASCSNAGCILLSTVTQFMPDTRYIGHGQTVSIDHNITLFTGSSLSDVHLKGSGHVLIKGSQVSVNNVVLTNPILVMADDARGCTFSLVECQSCDAVVKVLGGTGVKHGPASIGDMRLTDVVSGTDGFAAAIAHAEGRVVCAAGKVKKVEKPRILIQPMRPADVTLTGDCGSVVDLSTLLNVYGNAYTLAFFDGPPHEVGRVVYVIKVLCVALFMELTVLYLAVYHIMHLIHLVRRKKRV